MWNVASSIHSSFVSSVGEKISPLEQRVSEHAGVSRGAAVVNGNTALQVALTVSTVAALGAWSLVIV